MIAVGPTMQETGLTRYWIKCPHRHGPMGFGVTAYSLEDAIQIIQKWGYEVPNDLNGFVVSENIHYDQLDKHVQPNMGPMVVRGLWYPNQNFIGIPEWWTNK
jgi:hypothetical protein